jgi:hypothetical protein
MPDNDLKELTDRMDALLHYQAQQIALTVENGKLLAIYNNKLERLADLIEVVQDDLN